MEKRIELIPLAEIGQGNAYVTENSVEINLTGVSGALKAWLIGGEAVPIGNIVDGKLYKSVSTKGRIGILITQSGRQMFIGKFGKEIPAEEKTQQDHLLGADRRICVGLCIQRRHRVGLHFW